MIDTTYHHIYSELINHGLARLLINRPGRQATSVAFLPSLVISIGCGQGLRFRTFIQHTATAVEHLNSTTLSDVLLKVVWSGVIGFT